GRDGRARSAVRPAGRRARRESRRRRRALARGPARVGRPHARHQAGAARAGGGAARAPHPDPGDPPARPLTPGAAWPAAGRLVRPQQRYAPADPGHRRPAPGPRPRPRLRADRPAHRGRLDTGPAGRHPRAGSAGRLPRWRTGMTEPVQDQETMSTDAPVGIAAHVAAVVVGVLVGLCGTLAHRWGDDGLPEGLLFALLLVLLGGLFARAAADRAGMVLYLLTAV